MQASHLLDHHVRIPVRVAPPSKVTETFTEIVEISSDEEDNIEDGQPESSRRTILLSPTTKRTVVIESDGEEEEEPMTDLDMYYRMLEPIRTKRQKLNHNSQDDSAMTDAFDATDFIDLSGLENPELDMMLDMTDFTVMDISSNGLGISDNHRTSASTSETGLATSGNWIPAVKGKQNYRRSLLQEIKQEKKKARLIAPPYYDDPKLESRMYCGPGFEKFPVVLGSVPEHQGICDEWDEEQLKRTERRLSRQAGVIHSEALIGDATDDGSTVDEDEEEDSEQLELEVTKLDFLYKIREVLPDIQRKFALESIQQHLEFTQCIVNDEVRIQPDPAYIVSQILELPEYPKQENATKTGEPATDGTGVTIEWQKRDGENKTYQSSAIRLIATQFGYVPTHYICKIVQEKKSLFAAYVHIYDLNTTYDKLQPGQRPYRRSHILRQQLEKKYASPRGSLQPKGQWEALVNELQAARQHVERNRLKQARTEVETAAEEANLQQHKASGSVVECQCCFDDETPLNRAISCENQELHWFCFGCVVRLAENQVGAMKHSMACMDQSGCKADLSRRGVRLAIPAKLFDKLEFYQQQFEIAAACIEGLEQCPFCDFKAICDDIEVDSVFQCQNPDCRRVSCRMCQGDSHLPKSCEEVKQDKRISARHQIEEARSEAMMRTCPQCKVKIVKEVGCNKMRCGRCGCVMCYVCQADISLQKDSGYGHFHDVGSKCILYDKGFNRHETEANEAEKAAIKKVQAEITDIDEKQLQIETGKQPPEETSTQMNLAAADLFARPVAHRIDGLEPLLGFDDVIRQRRFRPMPPQAMHVENAARPPPLPPINQDAQDAQPVLRGHPVDAPLRRGRPVEVPQGPRRRLQRPYPPAPAKQATNVPHDGNQPPRVPVAAPKLEEEPPAPWLLQQGIDEPWNVGVVPHELAHLNNINGWNQVPRVMPPVHALAAAQPIFPGFNQALLPPFGNGAELMQNAFPPLHGLDENLGPDHAADGVHQRPGPFSILLARARAGKNRG